MDKGYIVPEAALKKLRVAKGLGQTVYIYGATGYGKTELVKQYLLKRRYRYISCAGDFAGLLEAAQGCPFPHETAGCLAHPDLPQPHPGLADAALCGRGIKIGRASCRERV